MSAHHFAVCDTVLENCVVRWCREMTSCEVRSFNTAENSAMNPALFAHAAGREGLFVDGDWVESKDQDPEGEARLLQLADIGDGEFLDKSARFLTIEKARQLKCTFLKPGDILIARMPDPLGRACIFPGASQPCVTVVDVCVVRVDPQIAVARWLMHRVNSPQFRHAVGNLAKGATRVRISRTNLGSIRLEFPPLPEQKRIAAILDKADAIRRKRRQAIELTNSLLRSAFLQMFGDPVTNPKGWEVRSFGDVGDLDRGRSRHRPRNDPRLLGGPHPLIQTGEVANAVGMIREYTQTYSDLGLAQSKMWPAGTLCISIAANIAQTAVLSFDACFPDSVVGFAPGPDVTTEYIQQWLSFLQPTLEAQAPQSAQKNINLRILRELDIPVPGMDDQKRFTAFVSKTREMLRTIRAARDAEAGLLNSLTQRAFAGGLS